MNKTELIEALTERGIPHDAESTNAVLETLLDAVNTYADLTALEEAKAITESLNETKVELAAAVKQVTDGDLQIKNLEERLSQPAPTVEVVAEDDEATSDRNEMIRAKVDAGLTPEQAASVVDAQIANDLAAE